MDTPVRWSWIKGTPIKQTFDNDGIYAYQAHNVMSGVRYGQYADGHYLAGMDEYRIHPHDVPLDVKKTIQNTVEMRWGSKGHASIEIPPCDTETYYCPMFTQIPRHGKTFLRFKPSSGEFIDLNHQKLDLSVQVYNASDIHGGAIAAKGIFARWDSNGITQVLHKGKIVPGSHVICPLDMTTEESKTVMFYDKTEGVWHKIDSGTRQYTVFVAGYQGKPHPLKRFDKAVTNLFKQAA